MKTLFLDLKVSSGCAKLTPKCYSYKNILRQTNRAKNNTIFHTYLSRQLTDFHVSHFNKIKKKVAENTLR
jgi:hypothetical protein